MTARGARLVRAYRQSRRVHQEQAWPVYFRDMPQPSGEPIPAGVAGYPMTGRSKAVA